MAFELWIVKHLRDLRSGKPETDVELFTSEADARDHVATNVVPRGFEPWQSDEETEDPAQVRTWCLGDQYHPDEYVELEGPCPMNGRDQRIAASARNWLEQKCVDEISLIDDYAETRNWALHWARDVDEVMAHHGITWPGGETAVEWAMKQEWPDDPKPELVIEERRSAARPMVDEGGSIDDGEEEWESDGANEFPEGSGG